MDARLEAHEIAEVQARLTERFPQLDAKVIEAEVRRAHGALTGGIRDFVPLLVERTARDNLAALADRDAPEATKVGDLPRRHG